MKKILVAVIMTAFAAGPVSAESMTVLTTVDGKSVKYVVLFFNTPLQGKRTVVAVQKGKIQIPDNFRGFRGYCLADSSKRAMKCVVR